MATGNSETNRSLDDSESVGLTGKIMVAGIIVLFMVIVFVLFLHLYAKYFWWRRQQSPSSASRSGSFRRRRFVFTPGQESAAGTAAASRLGLDPSVLRSLPVIIFESEKNGLECAVCLCELSKGEKARMLPKCNHGFHVDCIDMWFQSHSTCPLCRDPVAGNESNAKNAAERPPIEIQSDHNPNSDANEYETETPNFPTNVLFWGNQAQVSTGGSPPAPQPDGHSSSPATADRANEMLVIEIPRQLAETDCDDAPTSSSPWPAMRYSEEEPRSPMTTRLRSLKRLLSREKRAIACSPSSVVDAGDVEQGVSFKATSNS